MHYTFAQNRVSEAERRLIFEEMPSNEPPKLETPQLDPKKETKELIEKLDPTEKAALETTKRLQGAGEQANVAKAPLNKIIQEQYQHLIEKKFSPTLALAQIQNGLNASGFSFVRVAMNGDKPEVSYAALPATPETPEARNRERGAKLLKEKGGLPADTQIKDNEVYEMKLVTPSAKFRFNGQQWEMEGKSGTFAPTYAPNDLYAGNTDAGKAANAVIVELLDGNKTATAPDASNAPKSIGKQINEKWNELTKAGPNERLEKLMELLSLIFEAIDQFKDKKAEREAKRANAADAKKADGAAPAKPGEKPVPKPEEMEGLKNKTDQTYGNVETTVKTNPKALKPQDIKAALDAIAVERPGVKKEDAVRLANLENNERELKSLERYLVAGEYHDKNKDVKLPLNEATAKQFRDELVALTVKDADGKDLVDTPLTREYISKKTLAVRKEELEAAIKDFEKNPLKERVQKMGAEYLTNLAKTDTWEKDLYEKTDTVKVNGKEYPNTKVWDCEYDWWNASVEVACVDGQWYQRETSNGDFSALDNASNAAKNDKDMKEVFAKLKELNAMK